MGWLKLATSRPWGACLLERDWKMLKNHVKRTSKKQRVKISFQKWGILGKASSSKSPFKRAYVSSQEGIYFFVIWKNISEMIDRHLLYDFGWGNDDLLLQYKIGSDISFSYAFFFSVEIILCGLVMDS